MSYIDITRPIEKDMAVYSKEEGFSAEWQMCMPAKAYNLSRFSMGTHCGTHLDSPRHFIEKGQTVELAPLPLLNGAAFVLGVEQGFKLESVPEGTQRLLLRGAFCGLSPRDAGALIRRGVRLLGTSMLSACRPDLEAETHTVLLEHGVWLLENLMLDAVDDGRYDLMCLPLPLVGLEASPVRAILKKI